MATPADLRGPAPAVDRRRGAAAPTEPAATAPAASARRPGTEVLGERARAALDAVDFPSFVAELIQGTFQAVVDATSQQVRDYARLVADLSRTVDDFTRDNVSPNQARDWLTEQHPRDLTLVLPGPGSQEPPRVTPRDDAEPTPGWLADYGLAGAELTPELAEGAVLDAARRRLGEERMRTLATMVLMGINRIVIDDGQLRAKLQFHARAREKVTAEVIAASGGQQAGIAGRGGSHSAVSTMVSTVDVNAQADISMKAELVGEVALRFRTETFDLNNFADAPTVALITRHSLTRDGAAGRPAPGAPAPALPPGPASATPEPPAGGGQ
jgi:hypothetical protein